MPEAKITNVGIRGDNKFQHGIGKWTVLNLNTSSVKSADKVSVMERRESTYRLLKDGVAHFTALGGSTSHRVVRSLNEAVGIYNAHSINTFTQTGLTLVDKARLT